MSMIPRWRSVAQASTLILSVALMACATGAGAPQSGGSQGTGQSLETSDQRSASGEPNSPPNQNSASASGAPASKRRPCAGGECSVCGTGVCALGMFCVEGKDGAGCSWLPDCGSNDQCGCINKHLGSGCHCEQADKTVRVRCD